MRLRIQIYLRQGVSGICTYARHKKFLQVAWQGYPFYASCHVYIQFRPFRSEEIDTDLGIGFDKNGRLCNPFYTLKTILFHLLHIFLNWVI
jgi:hypothetical protein